jgi:hypothetical protein
MSALLDLRNGAIQDFQAEPPNAVDRVGIPVLLGLKSLEPARQLIPSVRGLSRRRTTE